MHLSPSHDPKSKTFEALAPVAYLILDQLSIIAPTKALLISKYYYGKVIPSLYYSVPLNGKLIYGLESSIPSSFDRTIKALRFHRILRVENMESLFFMRYYLAPFPNPQDVDIWEFQPMNLERIEFMWEAISCRFRTRFHDLYQDLNKKPRPHSYRLFSFLCRRGTLECAFHLDDDHLFTLEEPFDELEMALDQSPTVTRVLLIIRTSHPFQNLTRMIQTLFYRSLFTSEVRILIQLKENVKYTSDSDWEDAFGRPFWKAIVLAIADNAVVETAALSVHEDETNAFFRLMFYIPQAERFKQFIEKEGWESLLDDEEEKRLFELYWKDWIFIEEADRNLLDKHGYQCRSWSNMEVQT